MLSILIPTHNYDVMALVKQLHEQISKLQIAHEIMVYDNGSDRGIANRNEKIKDLTNTTIITSEKPIGISLAREFLVDKAKFDWILLLDADTQPKHNNFISQYVDYINTNNEVVFGGFSYKHEKPEKSEILRWKYGMAYENANAKQRNKTPYKITIAGNLLIKKQLYQSLNLHLIKDGYGMDLYLGPQLKKIRIPIMHIDNEVYHLGLETNETYLQKVELAIGTLLKLYNENQIDSHENDLLSVYIKLKRIKVNYVMSILYKILQHPIKKNLLSGNPSINLLQLYKLLYICHYDFVQKGYKVD